MSEVPHHAPTAPGSPGPTAPDTPAPDVQAARPHETEIRVRYDEVDRMGVVHHPRYLVYFELGRTEYLRSLGGTYRGLEDAGTLLMVTEASARYLKPARYDDVITVRTRLSEMGPVRLRFDYEVVRGRDRLATGCTVLAACDREGRPVRIPDAFRTAMAPCLPGKSEEARGVQRR